MLFKKKRIKIPDPPNNSFPEVEGMKPIKSADLFDWKFGQDMPKGKEQFHDGAELPKESDETDMNNEIDQGSADDGSFDGFGTQEFDKPGRKDRKDKQIFIKIENFKEIVASLETMGNKLKELDDIVSKLRELNSEEGSEVDAWKTDIDTIKEEIKTIGNSLAEE